MIEIDDRQGRVPYEYIKEKFILKDPEIMASNTFSTIIDSTIYLKLIGKLIKVIHPSAQIYDENDKLITSYTIKTLILRFLVNGQGIKSTGKDITYKDIPGGLVYYPNFKARTLERLARNYGYNLIKFDEDMENIDAVLTNQGDRGYRFSFINETFITFIIWEKDEEFEPTANILFDQNIQFYFDAEDLAVVPDVAIDIIKNKGTISEWMNLYSSKK